jgi:hypothetical protein
MDGRAFAACSSSTTDVSYSTLVEVGGGPNCQCTPESAAGAGCGQEGRFVNFDPFSQRNVDSAVRSSPTNRSQQIHDSPLYHLMLCVQAAERL